MPSSDGKVQMMRSIDRDSREEASALTETDPTSDSSIEPIVDEKDLISKTREFLREKEIGISFDELTEEGKLRAIRLAFPAASDLLLESSSPHLLEPWMESLSKRIHSQRKTTFREQLEILCQKYPEWGDMSRYFFDDPRAIDDFMVIRRQKAGLCFMDAPVVVQHYAHCVRNGRKTAGKDHKMLDISWFIRERFSEEKLRKFLEGEGGGNSLEFLAEITGNDFRLMRENAIPLPVLLKLHLLEPVLQTVYDHFFQLKGPVLVSNFKVEADFKTDNKFVYDGHVDGSTFVEYGKECGKKNGRCIILHSLVIIAMYKDEQTKKFWFLVQNFWANKYLVIMSGEYLASCGAILSMYHQEYKTSLTRGMNVIDADYAETETAMEGEYMVMIDQEE